MNGALLLILVLAVPLLAVILLTVWPSRGGDRAAPLVGTIASGIPLVLLVVATAGLDFDALDRMQLETDVRWVPALDLRFHVGVDGVSLPLALLTALLVFCSMLYTMRIRPEGGRMRGFVALVLLLEVGMVGTFVALDLLVFFLFFELVLIPMWFVIAWWGDPHDRPGRTTAATTFILYTLSGSALMLVGFLLVHARTGTFDMVQLAAGGGAGMSSTVQLLAALAIIAGLAVKVPVWPLHTWLPDAHAKAPTVGSVLLAGVLLKMGSYGLIRIALPVVPEGTRTLAPWLGALGVVGIIYGSLACLAQRDLKRLIAYSSVGHMGFVVLGVATMTQIGVNGAMFANIAHGLITGLLFFVVGAIKDRHGTSEFADLGGGLYARAPHLGGLLAFAAVASLGLPGLAGFWGEMMSMLGAFEPAQVLDRPYFLVLMGLAGLGAVLTAAYLLVMVRRVNQGADEIGPRLTIFGDVTTHEVVAWSPLIALTLALGLWPALLLQVTTPAVSGLLGGLL